MPSKCMSPQAYMEASSLNSFIHSFASLKNGLEM